MIKKLFCTLLLLAAALSLTACQNPEGETAELTAPEVTGGFEVTALSVGKADSLILKTDNHTVLIDCGEKDDGKDILAKLAEMGASKLDYLFITHFDQDHVGGAPKIISNIEISEIVTPDYEGTNPEYAKYSAMIEELGIVPTLLTNNLTFKLDDVLLCVYPPMKSNYKEEDNDFSIVISAVHGGNTFLFAGDAEDERIAEIYRQLPTIEHKFLKIPHHGVYSAATAEFIQKVNPKIAVITCSEKNPADEEILDTLAEIGCDTRLTADADVKIFSDGKEISVF